MPIDPVLDLTADNIKDYVYVKTNVGGWFFDAWISMEHSSKLTITDHPVQTGAAISDHAFLQPRSLSMEIGMSDVATSFIPGQFDGDWSRSVAAYKVILELQRLRIPVQILTRLGSARKYAYREYNRAGRLYNLKWSEGASNVPPNHGRYSKDG
ncbi:hypothetical protein LJK87_50080 [Paenibacillus sp. P25]|nr:hypothetical protein LJK87_50080 [Paenibacillus sp. P25]